MNPEFWHERWQKREIAFHQAAANPLLVSHFDKLALTPGGPVFYHFAVKASISVGYLHRDIRLLALS